MKILLSIGLALGAMLNSIQAHATAPVIGQPAPPLTFTDLLQAPDGTQTDWTHLRGKVVVLEFWATWCGGCVEQIPHLNALMHSLPADKFQFIAVDDEDPAKIKKFLTKTPIDSWVGLDTSRGVIDAYDVHSFPHTFIIDPEGRTAAILSPIQLDKDQLLALADGKTVAFPADITPAFPAASKGGAYPVSASAVGDGKPHDNGSLLEISLRPSDSKDRNVGMTQTFGTKPDGSFTTDSVNASLAQLLQFAGGLSKDRFTVVEENQATYSLHVNAFGGETEQLSQAIQLAIATATGRKISHKTTEQEVYLLETTPKSSTLLPPSTGNGGSYCYYNAPSGSLVLMNKSLDKLAHTLEDATGVPILNETNLTGQFEASFNLPKTDFDSVKAALEKNLGLTLTKARRPIEHVILEAPATVAPTTSASKP
jgi:uncharacterized protein (TIGR03435 family)